MLLQSRLHDTSIFWIKIIYHYAVSLDQMIALHYLKLDAFK